MKLRRDPIWWGNLLQCDETQTRATFHRRRKPSALPEVWWSIEGPFSVLSVLRRCGKSMCQMQLLISLRAIKSSPRGSRLCQAKSPAEVPFPGFLNHCLFGEFGLPDILEQQQQFINSLTSTARLVVLFFLAGSYFYFFKRYNSITWNCWSCIFIRLHQ